MEQTLGLTVLVQLLSKKLDLKEIEGESHL